MIKLKRHLSGAHHVHENGPSARWVFLFLLSHCIWHSHLSDDSFGGDFISSPSNYLKFAERCHRWLLLRRDMKLILAGCDDGNDAVGHGAGPIPHPHTWGFIGKGNGRKVCGNCMRCLKNHSQSLITFGLRRRSAVCGGWELLLLHCNLSIYRYIYYIAVDMDLQLHSERSNGAAGIRALRWVDLDGPRRVDVGRIKLGRGRQKEIVFISLVLRNQMSHPSCKSEKFLIFCLKISLCHCF